MLVLSLVAVVGMVFVMGILYRYFGRQIKVELQKEALYLSQGTEQNGISYLEKVKDKRTRITYVAADGTVLYDSASDAKTMENHKERAEIKKAMEYGQGEAVRMSDTLGEKTIYRAVRLSDGSVLRVSNTQYSIFALLGQLILPMCWIIVLMLILSGIFAANMSKRIVEPINRLDLEHPEENQIYEEVEPLLSRIYRQNRQIQKQLEDAKSKQERFALITENMEEGLLVIDKYTMILSANSGVWKQFRMEKQEYGQSVYSLNRSEEFRHVIEHVLEGRHQEVVLRSGGNTIRMIGNPVEKSGKTEGAVLLFLDIKERTVPEETVLSVQKSL